MNEELIQEIISIIKDKVDIDFENYKINTILRRLRQRISILNFNSIDEYYKYFIENLDKETKILSEYFLIKTTEFFREPVYFYYFQKLAKDLISSKRNFIKILCIGCSSGEEPYSIAMILSEKRSKNPRFDFQIDAFDVDPDTISEAKKAIYVEEALNNVPHKFIKKYFHKLGDRYKLDTTDFEKNISFYVMDIFKMKSSFQGILQYNFIFARNIFLYIKEHQTTKLFEKIIPMLEKGGYLILGSAELPPKKYAYFFKQICPGIKIFKFVA